MSNTIGKNIKSLRQKMNWTQGQVAEKLNISIPAYSKLETGITDPNFSRLQQMADFFAVDVSELISVDGDNLKARHEMIVESLIAESTTLKTEIVGLQRKVIELYEKLDNKKICG